MSADGKKSKRAADQGKTTNAADGEKTTNVADDGKTTNASDGGKTMNDTVGGEKSTKGFITLNSNRRKVLLLAAVVLAVVVIAVLWHACSSDEGSGTNTQDAAEETQADGSEDEEAGDEASETVDSGNLSQKTADPDDGSDAENSDDGANAADPDTGNSNTDNSDTEDTDAANPDTSDSDTSGSDAANSGTSGSDISNSKNTNSGDSASDQTDTGSADTALPEIQNTESLSLSSVYTSDILNPECGFEYAEEVASLEVTNSSERYLVAATLVGTMSDGTEVTFQVNDLPAGATAEIFDTANQTLSADATCTSLTCTSEEYLDADADVLLAGSLEITVSGQDAVITNTGSATLKDLTVVYHCDMSGQYFGGASYTITIDSLAAGESYTLSDGSLFGAVAVVRVY